MSPIYNVITTLFLKLFNKCVLTSLYLSGDDNSNGSFNSNRLRGVLLRTIELLLKLEQPDFVGVSS